MTNREFNRLVRAARLGGDRLEAARLVLVRKKGLNEAARELDVDRGSLSRIVRQIRELQLCECCGQPLHKK